MLGFLTVGLSRLIVGVHSLDQVIYGFLLGLWTVAYVLLYWRQVIKNHIISIKKRTYTRKYLGLFLLYFGCMSAIVLVLLTVIYHI